MTPCRARAILAFLLGGSLAAVFAPAALAVEERGWFSLEAGALVYDPEQALRDGPALSLRATWFLNRWIGVEGLAQTASPTQDPTALGDATFTHVGGGLVATPDRHGWALPYLYAGYGSVSVDRDGFASENAGAFHGGVGAVFRMGERIGLRLDARDVTYEQQSGPGRDSTRVHSFQIAAGVTLFYFGRPRDTDEDGLADYLDWCPTQSGGKDKNGCPDGAYLVRWKVVLLDGDESEGEYVFYVGAKPPLAGQPMSSGSSASADSPPNGKFTMWISVVIIALILVILVYLFRRARFRA